nr:unnamed protein product [Digitaria exilis]
MRKTSQISPLFGPLWQTGSSGQQSAERRRATREVKGNHQRGRLHEAQWGRSSRPRGAWGASGGGRPRRATRGSSRAAPDASTAPRCRQRPPLRPRRLPQQQPETATGASPSSSPPASPALCSELLPLWPRSRSGFFALTGLRAAARPDVPQAAPPRPMCCPQARPPAAPGRWEEDVTGRREGERYTARATHAPAVPLPPSSHHLARRRRRSLPPPPLLPATAACSPLPPPPFLSLAISPTPPHAVHPLHLAGAPLPPTSLPFTSLPPPSLPSSLSLSLSHRFPYRTHVFPPLHLTGAVPPLHLAVVAVPLFLSPSVPSSTFPAGTRGRSSSDPLQTGPASPILPPSPLSVFVSVLSRSSPPPAKTGRAALQRPIREGPLPSTSTHEVCPKLLFPAARVMEKNKMHWLMERIRVRKWKGKPPHSRRT